MEHFDRCCAAQLDETSRAAAVDRQRLQRLNKELELATQSEADAKVSRLLAETIAPNRRPLYAEATIGRGGAGGLARAQQLALRSAARRAQA